MSDDFSWGILIVNGQSCFWRFAQRSWIFYRVVVRSQHFQMVL